MVDSDFGLCGTCWRDTPFIVGTVCDACGVPLHGDTDGHRLECDDCLRTPRPWHRGRAAVLYKDRAKQLILALKHGDRPEIARPAALWMMRAAKPLLQKDTLIVPVPLHPTRLLRRKYNQAALISKALAEATGLDHCPDLLVRPKRTLMQDHKTVPERFAALADAISVHPRRRHLAAARHVLLVDDVMTSGATFAACSHACHSAGAAEVCVLSLARVAKDT
jgi:ComF family protein